MDELILCRFIVALAGEGLSPATIKTYLSGVRHAQILRGLPEPGQTTSMARLKLVQAGVALERANRGISTADRRLPISVRILHRMIAAWAALPPTAAQAMEPNELFDNTMLSVAALLCFFGFFRSGELTVPSATAFDEWFHLAWGDVAVDDSNLPAMIKIHLKRSKWETVSTSM